MNWIENVLDALLFYLGALDDPNKLRNFFDAEFLIVFGVLTVGAVWGKGGLCSTLSEYPISISDRRECVGICGGGVLDLAPPHERSSFDLPRRNDLRNLSTSRVWKLKLDSLEAGFGGLEPALLFVGDVINELCEFLDEDLENCCFDVIRCICIGWLRCAGEPGTKSLPGDVESDGHSDLEHSLIFRERQFELFEHSEMRLDFPLPL